MKRFICSDQDRHQIISLKGLKSVKKSDSKITFAFKGVDRYWVFQNDDVAKKAFQKIKDSLHNTVNIDKAVKL